MTVKEIEQLKPGDFIMHSWLGKCRFKEILPDTKGKIFGVVIAPRTWDGAIQLMHASGMPLGTPFMEDSYRNVKPYNDDKSSAS